MPVENPHYWITHGCTGCLFGNRLHVGCVVGGSVRVVEEGKVKEEKPPVEKLEVEKPVET